MKLLLDSCVWGGARADLQARGHDVGWCGDWEVDLAAGGIATASPGQLRMRFPAVTSNDDDGGA